MVVSYTVDGSLPNREASNLNFLRCGYWPDSDKIFRRNVLYLSFGLIIAAFAIFLNPRSRSASNTKHSINEHPNMATPSPAKLEAAKNKKRFLDVFPNIVEELLDTVRVENMPEEVVEWYKRVGNLANESLDSVPEMLLSILES